MHVYFTIQICWKKSFLPVINKPSSWEMDQDLPSKNIPNLIFFVLIFFAGLAMSIRVEKAVESSLTPKSPLVGYP